MEKFLEEKLKNLSIAIVHHWCYHGGNEYSLFEVIKNKVKIIYFLHHPFKGYGEINTSLEIYQNGQLTYKKKAWPIRLPGALHYLKDIFYNIFYGIFKMKKIDIFIGADNSNALSGLILKKLGRVKKVIFYTIDYVPVRFSNKFINKIYHLFDKICVRFCDQTWNQNPRVTAARPDNLRPKQTIVPMGSFVERIPFKSSLDDVEKYTLFFLGGFQPNVGLELAIQGVNDLKNDFPQIKLKIIGRGPEENRLKELVKSLHLENQVIFLGYIPDLKEVEKLITPMGIGLALYEPSEKQPYHFSWYGGSGKILNYLAAGLPVLVTREPYLSAEIDRHKCGLVVDYSVEKIKEAVKILFENEELYRNLKINARKFAESLSWEKIFNDAFKKIV